MIKEKNTETCPDAPMGDPLARWHTDHLNFARLLDIVEKHVDSFHKGKRPDYELMRMIVYYLRHYPDRFHHPREDVAFARLIVRDSQLQVELARRMQEHVVIAAAGEELLKCLNEIVAGGVVERATLLMAAATYLVYYRHHLAAEEHQVIPRAVQLLTPADWAAVAAIAAEPDPLFGPEPQARYSELRERLKCQISEQQ